MSDKTRITFRKSRESDNLIIYFPGLLVDGDTSSRRLITTWLKFGDALLLNYATENFAVKELLDAALDEIKSRKFNKLILIGASDGGLPAHDLILRLRKQKFDESRIRLLLVDSPSKPDDYQPLVRTAGTFAAKLRVGQRAARFLSSKVTDKYPLPHDDNIEPGVNRMQLIADSRKMMRPYGVQFAHDAFQYVMTHKALKPGELANITAVYGVCVRNNETIVQPRAYESWLAAIPGLPRIDVDSTDIGFLERPKTWQKFFVEALEKLLG